MTVKKSDLINFIVEIKHRNLVEIYQIAQLHFPDSAISWISENKAIRIDNHEILFDGTGKCKIEFDKKIDAGN